MRTAIVSVSGFSSEVGKTTILCDLLGWLSGWEAMKITRGHYRSCGKDPHTCCVSFLLGDRPLIFSGRDQTYKEGKDTGRYWEAGASNVHWVVGTDDQVGEGLEIALNRVISPGVLIEGTSLLKHIPVDFSVMVAKPPITDIKSSAVSAMAKVDAIVISGSARNQDAANGLWESLGRRGVRRNILPLYFDEDKPLLYEQIAALVRKKIDANSQIVASSTSG